MSNFRDVSLIITSISRLHLPNVDSHRLYECHGWFLIFSLLPKFPEYVTSNGRPATWSREDILHGWANSSLPQSVSPCFRFKVQISVSKIHDLQQLEFAFYEWDFQWLSNGTAIIIKCLVFSFRKKHVFQSFSKNQLLPILSTKKGNFSPGNGSNCRAVTSTRQILEVDALKARDPDLPCWSL